MSYQTALPRDNWRVARCDNYISGVEDNTYISIKLYCVTATHPVGLGVRYHVFYYNVDVFVNVFCISLSILLVGYTNSMNKVLLCEHYFEIELNNSYTFCLCAKFAN